MSWLVPHRLGVIMKMEYSPGSERPANESHFSCYGLAVIKIFMPRVTGESRKFKREERTPSRELSLFLQSENQVAAVKSPSSSVGHREVDLLTGRWKHYLANAREDIKPILCMEMTLLYVHMKEFIQYLSY